MKTSDYLDIIEGVLGNSVPLYDEEYFKETKDIGIRLIDYFILEFNNITIEDLEKIKLEIQRR